MKIEHIAIWTSDLEKMRAFYLDFFELESNEKYYNPKKQPQELIQQINSNLGVEK